MWKSNICDRKSMNINMISGIISAILIHLTGVVCVSFNETRDVHEQIVSFYSNSNKSLTDIIPLEDLSQPITVELTLCLYSVDGYDAVKGQVDISASLYMEWIDETFASSIGNYDFSKFDTGYSVTISPNVMWTPTIVLLNAVGSVKSVGDKSIKVRYLVTDGRMKWQPRDVIKASCKPNVKYYPFDRQDCSFIYTAWGYNTEELVLETAQSDWYLCDYTANAIWTLVKTSAEEYVKNGQSYVEFKFTIERQPLFFVINVLLPIVLLAFLDGFVFLLPAESGERVGFCVTCFLSFVFMLQTVLSFLPQTAEPMSILCVYIVIMMMTSIAQCIVTVVMLRIYHTPDDSKVPYAVQRLVTVVTCAWVGQIWRNRRTACRKSETSQRDENQGYPDEEHVRPVSLGSIGVTENHASFSNHAKVGPFRNTFMNTGSEAASTIFSIKSAFTERPVDPSATSINHFALRDPERTFDYQQPSPSVMSTSLPNSPRPTEAEFGDSVDCAEDEPSGEKALKWADVGRALDNFFFFAFTGFQMVFTMVYIIPMSNSAQ